MEDDDEFGDLYTDVLRPLTTSFQSQPQQQRQPQQQNKELIKPTVTTSNEGRPIDLNVNRGDDDEDDGSNFFGAPNSNSTGNSQTQASSQSGYNSRRDLGSFDLSKVSGQEEGNSGGLVGVESDLQAKVLETKGGDVKLPERTQGSSGFGNGEADIDVIVEERDEKEEEFVVKDENLTDRSGGNVENFSMGDPVIPGLSIPGVSGGVKNRANASANYDDDWDSDSEDDLQIVLNDSNHGPMGTERVEGGGGGMGGEDDDDEDDEDGEPLVIVGESDDLSRQPMMMEKQDWGGEEVGAGGDGEKKELGEGAKINGVGGGSGVTQKIGYSGHGYHHPFHSQFKVSSDVAALLGFGAFTLLFDEILQCNKLACNCCIVLWKLVILDSINAVVVCANEVDCCTGIKSPVIKMTTISDGFSIPISMLSFVQDYPWMLQFTC